MKFETLTKEERAARTVFGHLVQNASLQSLLTNYGTLAAYQRGNQKHFHDYLLPGRAIMWMNEESRAALAHFSSKLAGPTTFREQAYIGIDAFQTFSMSQLAAHAREVVRDSREALKKRL